MINFDGRPCYRGRLFLACFCLSAGKKMHVNQRPPNKSGGEGSLHSLIADPDPERILAEPLEFCMAGTILFVSDSRVFHGVTLSDI